MSYINHSALVSAEWLKDNLSCSSVKVVDATWYLPNLPKNARSEYEHFHIPKAVFFDIDEMAERYGIKNYLRWIQYTDDEEVFNFYKAADIFMCSSLYEGFNITPLEAMFCGAPVICSNMSSLPEVVGDAAYMIDDPRDPIEMEKAITDVLSDEDLQSKLSERGKERAKIFSWDRCAQETIDIFKTLT